MGIVSSTEVTASHACQQMDDFARLEGIFAHHRPRTFIELTCALNGDDPFESRKQDTPNKMGYVPSKDIAHIIGGLKQSLGDIG